MLPGFESNLITDTYLTATLKLSLSFPAHKTFTPQLTTFLNTLTATLSPCLTFPHTNPSNIYRLASLSHTQNQATFIALPHFPTHKSKQHLSPCLTFPHTKPSNIQFS
eukprot:TCONS_00035088-protein